MTTPRRPPESPAEMLAEAERLDGEAKQLDAMSAAIRKRAEEWRSVARQIEALRGESISSLPAPAHSGTINPMDSTQIVPVPPKRTRGVPLESNGPYAKVARALGVSLAEVGRRLKENVHTVRTWDARKHVPEGVQDRLDALVEAHRAGSKRRR